MIRYHNGGRAFILGFLLCMAVILLGSYDAHCLQIPQPPIEICIEEALEGDDYGKNAAQSYKPILCPSTSIFTYFIVGFQVYSPLPNFFCNYISNNFQDRSPPV